jgi:hypothetical protein
MDKTVDACRPRLIQLYSTLDNCLKSHRSEDVDSLWDETTEEIKVVNGELFDGLTADKATQQLEARKRAKKNRGDGIRSRNLEGARKTDYEENVQKYKDRWDHSFPTLDRYFLHGSNIELIATVLALSKDVTAIPMPRIRAAEIIGETTHLSSGKPPACDSAGIESMCASDLSPSAAQPSASPISPPSAADARRQVLLPITAAVIAGVAIGLLVTAGMALGGVMLSPFQFAPFIVYPSPLVGLASGIGVTDRVRRRYTPAYQLDGPPALGVPWISSVLRTAACGAVVASLSAAALSVTLGFHPADMPGLALGATLGGGGGSAYSRYFMRAYSHPPAEA